MGIDVRVAMPGEMLYRRDHSVILEAADFGDDEPADLGGLSPNERTLMIGFAGLLLTSATGAKASWIAHGAAFQRRDSADFVGRAVAPGCRDAHIGWEWRASDETDTGAALEIRCDEQRQVRAALQLVQLCGDVER